jgi:hypothetical protein
VECRLKVDPEVRDLWDDDPLEWREGAAGWRFGEGGCFPVYDRSN